MPAVSPLIYDTIRVLLVASHVVAVAIAVGLVFWQDLALLTSRRLNSMQFQLASTRITRALIVLWLTGLIIIGLDTGFDIGVLAARPKIQAKVLVVTLLSLNGWALHRIAFPALMGMQTKLAGAPAVIAVLGAISTISWAYAIFLGVARPLTLVQLLGFRGFIGLYIALLVGGILVALLVARPRIKILLLKPVGFTAGQVIAILFGLGRIEYAGALHRHKTLEQQIAKVSKAPRHSSLEHTHRAERLLDKKL